MRRLWLTVFPGDDWEVGFLGRPRERLLFLTEVFELDRQFALLHFVVRKSLSNMNVSVPDRPSPG
jgi:hypothetical protein